MFKPGPISCKSCKACLTTFLEKVKNHQAENVFPDRVKTRRDQIFSVSAHKKKMLRAELIQCLYRIRQKVKIKKKPDHIENCIVFLFFLFYFLSRKSFSHCLETSVIGIFYSKQQYQFSILILFFARLLDLPSRIVAHLFYFKTLMLGR